MLTKGIVSYLRGAGPLFVFVLAIVSATPMGAAVATYDSPTSQKAGTGIDRLLSVSVSEHGWEPVEHLRSVADAKGPVGVQSLVYTPDDGQEQQDDFSTVARHRGFRKFFLLVFICGAVIRFFTSPTFVTFITDALDPKSW